MRWARLAAETSLTLEGHVLSLDLIRTASGPWEAELRLRLELGSTHGNDVFVSSAHTATRKLPGASADGLGDAVTGCISDILGQAAAVWRKAGAWN